MNNQVHTSTRQLFRLSIGVILMLVIMSLFQLFKSDATRDIEKLQVHLQERSSMAQEELINLKSYNSVEAFSSDPFYEDWIIRVYQDEQLVWWKESSIHSNLDKANQAFFKNTSTKGNKKITIHFPVTSGPRKQVQRKYLASASCRDIWEATGSNGQTLDLGDEDTINLASKGKFKSLNYLRFQSLLYIILFLLLFMFLYRQFDFGHMVSVAIYSVIIIFFRSIALFFDLFSSVEPLNIGSQIFKTSFLSPGIADLFLNGILLVFLSSALSKYVDHKISTPQTSSSKIITVITTSLIGLSTLLFIAFIQRWVSATYDLFEIEKVFNTSATGILNILSVLLLSCGLFTFHLALYKSLSSSHKDFSQRLIVIGLVLLVTILVAFFGELPINPFFFGLGFASYLILIDLFLDSRSLNITWLLCWIIVISSFLSLFIFKNVNDYRQQLRKEFLHKQYHESETSKANWISGNFSKLISADSELLDSLVSPDRTVNQEGIDGIIEKLELEIKGSKFFEQVDYVIFDENGKALGYSSAQHNAALKRSITTAFKVENDIWFDPIDNKYVYHHFGKKDSFGYQLSLSFTSENEQSIAKKFPYSSSAGRDVHSYAIYKDQQIIYSNKNAQLYPSNLNLESIAKGEIISRQSNYTNELYVEHDNGIAIASYEEVSDLIKPISLFSYIFSLLGILLVMLTLLHNYSNFLPKDFSLHVDSNSLRDKIQLSVVSLIIISFIAIAIVTGYYFTRISEGYSDTILSDKVNAIVTDSKLHIADELYQNDTEDLLKTLSQMSSIHRSDILLYDTQGQLSSAELSSNEMDRIIPYDVYSILSKDPDRMYISTDKIARNHEIKSIYKAINFKKDILAYVQVLYPSNINTSIELDDFLGTLLNVYVFLFILAGGLAIAVANSVTYPLSRLGEKLRQFSLGRKNEPLGWENKGEIGALINEYNQLILKLEESANFIAKTERDSAWREMAKQVAHEIKNPLTSMKLSIQHLQRAIGRDPDNAKDLIERVSSTLIEQITNLSQIAGEFSNFGQLPQAQNEKLIMNEIIAAIHDLFRKRDDMDITLTVPIDEIYVFADKNHLIRILNNLVKNAIQAIPQKRRGKIKLSLYKDEDYAYIKVNDNGIGIPEDMYEKVFTPNFTTKSSGTGLGLAIAANMIEAFNGKIYFETEVDKGTDFFVRIPLMRLEDNYKMDNKVNLD